MVGYVLLSVVISIGAVLAQVPIPNRPLGYVYKSVAPTAPVHIEFFIDLICPDSKAAFPVLKQVGDHYGNSVRIAAIPFPLPYHRNAYLAAKGIHVVNNMTKGDIGKVYDWMSVVFENQEKFGETVNYNIPEKDTVAVYGTLAASLGLSTDSFAQLLTTDTELDYNTRIEWKYACTRGVAGTPWFTVNGVTVGADGSWTLKDWNKLIDPLLADNHLVYRRHLFEVTDTCKDGTKRCEYLPGKIECCTPGEGCIPNVGCRC